MVSEFLTGGLDLDDSLAGEQAGVETAAQGGWSEEQLAIIEQWKQSEDGRRYVSAKTKERSRSTASDLRKALEGDSTARQNLGSDGKRLLRMFDEVTEGLQTKARETLDTELARLLPAAQVYNQVLWEQENDPAAYAQRMRDPRQRTFVSQMEELNAKYGRGQGQSFTPSQARQVARQEAAEDTLDAVLEELRDEDDEKLLTDADWGDVEDAAEGETDPKKALRAARKVLTAKLANAKALASTRGVVERTTQINITGQNARNAANAAPTAAGGRASAPAAGRSEMQIALAYKDDPGNERARKDFEEMAKRNNWKF